MIYCALCVCVCVGVSVCVEGQGRRLVLPANAYFIDSFYLALSKLSLTS